MRSLIQRLVEDTNEVLRMETIDQSETWELIPERLEWLLKELRERYIKERTDPKGVVPAGSETRLAPVSREAAEQRWDTMIGPRYRNHYQTKLTFDPVTQKRLGLWRRKTL